jgi:hypothetical protein
MLDSKDYNTAGSGFIGAENSNRSGDSRSSVGSDKNSSGSSRRKSSSNRSSSSSPSSSNNTGISKSKIRSRIKTLKKLFFLGGYAFLMLISVSHMMDEQLIRSFWMDLAAFCLIWTYYALSSQKIIKLFRVSKSWFYAHAVVVLTHLAVALFLGDADVNAGVSQPIHQPDQTQPVVQPYQVEE